MYKSINKLNKAILDNQKFFSQNSIIYEKNVHAVSIKNEDDIEEQMNYSYGLPNQNDMYQYRYDSFIAGHRDADREPRPYVDIKLPQPSNNVENFQNDSGVCSVDSDGVVNICGKGKNLYNIMDPRFNLREAAKNMLLLEDHLFQSGKNCSDCIKKHCLMIEGFLEEGITLDKTQQYVNHFENSIRDFRVIFKKLSDKIDTLTIEDCRDFAQQIRKIRKPLCQEFATFF